MSRHSTLLTGSFCLVAAALAGGCGGVILDSRVHPVDVRSMAPSPGVDERGLVLHERSSLSRAERQARVMQARRSGNLEAPGDAAASIDAPSRPIRN
ncbi:MAG TPA: hypothetical protein VFF72_10875 [Caldimonas sp.]|nr:hypothetical protein [Caldimonas sp.]